MVEQEFEVETQKVAKENQHKIKWFGWMAMTKNIILLSSWCWIKKTHEKYVSKITLSTRFWNII
jgi:hypothetical protein